MTLRAASELAQRPELMEPPEMIAPPCGVAGRVALLTFGPKGGKSSTLCAMIAEASRAGVRGAILGLDEAKADTLQRLVRYGAVLELVYLDDVFEPAELEEQLATLDIDLLGVDHLGKLAEGHPDFRAGSQGDPLLWGRLVSPFTTLARAQNLAVILLDQARKSDGTYSGSTAKAGSVDLLVELQARDGGLEATPKGRVQLPAFRVELDADNIPRFSGAAVSAAPDAPDGRARELLQFLSDSEPEGLTSSGWEKVSGFPKTSYNRNRKALLRDGLALSPAETRGGRYRITDKGETSLLVPLVPLGAIGTNGTLGRIGAIGTTTLKSVVPGTSQDWRDGKDRTAPMVPNARATA